MLTIPEAFSQALQHQQAGNFPQAEQLYRQILQVDPQHVKAWHFLGVLAYWAGRNDLAVEYISQALRFKPDYADAHNNLGLALKNQGKLDEAEASYRRALQLNSNSAEAYSNLGHTLQKQWRLDEAVASYRQALSLKPDFADAYNNLGIALREQGKMEEAKVSFQEAVRLKPGIAEAHNNLGGVLKDMGMLDEALAAYRHALALRPDSRNFTATCSTPCTFIRVRALPCSARSTANGTCGMPNPWPVRFNLMATIGVRTADCAWATCRPTFATTRSRFSQCRYYPLMTTRNSRSFAMPISLVLTTSPRNCVGMPTRGGTLPA